VDMVKTKVKAAVAAETEEAEAAVVEEARIYIKAHILQIR